MNPPLFVGARITALCLPQHLLLLGSHVRDRVPMRGEVLDVVVDGQENNRRIVWRTAAGFFGPWLRPHLEGIEWIRGHHSATSAEVLALLAAAALVGDG